MGIPYDGGNGSNGDMSRRRLGVTKFWLRMDRPNSGVWVSGLVLGVLLVCGIRFSSNRGIRGICVAALGSDDLYSGCISGRLDVAAGDLDVLDRESIGGMVNPLEGLGVVVSVTAAGST